jgi:hypothetical protein
MLLFPVIMNAIQYYIIDIFMTGKRSMTKKIWTAALPSVHLRAQSPTLIMKGKSSMKPPRVTWWLKQSVVYFMGLLGMKICVFFLIELLLENAEKEDQNRNTEGSLFIS